MCVLPLLGANDMVKYKHAMAGDGNRATQHLRNASTRVLQLNNLKEKLKISSPVRYSLHCSQQHLRCQRRVVLQGVAQTPRLAHIVRKHNHAHYAHQGHCSAEDRCKVATWDTLIHNRATKFVG